MEEKAVGLALDIIGRVLTAQVAQGIHQHLIDELIEEIGKSDGPRPELDADKVEVVVPFPLTQAQQERLSTIFSSRMGRPVNIHETIDAEIVAGMGVRVGKGGLGGRPKNKVKGKLGHV